MFLRFFVCCFISFSSIAGQTSNDLCELITCPIDCDKKETANGCFDCLCHNTTRCSTMKCPCWTAVKLDGCETCYCSGPTYSLLDDNKNEELFLKEGVKSGTRGVCSLEDRYGVDECLIPYRNYMKEIKAEIQLQPARELYPIFAYRKQHLPTLCKLFRTAEKCIGVNMLSRCRTQEKTLNALEVLLEPICRRNELSFVDHFDCLNNLLKENENLRYCTRDALNSIITTESAANMDGSRKRLEKCETFNKLLECSRSSIVEKCSQAHWQLFLFAIQSSLPSTAPECYVSDKNNRIAPIDNNYKPPFEVPEKFPVFTNNSGVTDSYETTSNPATQLLLNTTSSFISSISTGNTEITGSTGSTSNNNSTSHSSAILTTTTPITTTSLKETTATTSQPLVTTKNLVDENSIFVNKGTTLSQIVGDIQSTTSTQTSTIRQTTSSSTSKKTIVSPPGRIPDETKTSGKESPETPEILRQGTERCYKIPERHNCVTREKPQSVIRWYRQKNQLECTFYMYNYCDPQTERMEQPFRYEEECYDVCFSEAERSTSPFLKKLKFYDGFRVKSELIR